MAVIVTCLFVAGAVLAVVGCVLGWATPSHPRGRTASNCMVAAWIVLFGLAGLSSLLSSGRTTVGCGALLWFLLMVIGTCLAIAALVVMRRRPEDWPQGKLQAGLVLLSGMLSLAAVAVTVFRIPRAQEVWASEETQREKLTFADLNFEIVAPPSPWTKMNAGRIQDATLVYALGNRAFFMVFAEKAGIETGLTTLALVEAAKANLRSVAPNAVVHEKKRSVHDLHGVEVVSKFRRGSRDWFMRNWVVGRNGFAYQVLIQGRQSLRKRLEPAFTRLLQGFRLIDPERMAHVEGHVPLTDFHSARYGYSIRLKGSDWSSWPDVHANMPVAEFGILQGTYSAFVAAPIFLGSEEPTLDQLAQALLLCLDINYTTGTFSGVRRFQEGGRTGIELEHERTVDGTWFRYKLRILQGKRFGYLFAAWQGRDTPANVEPLADAMSRIVLPENEPGPPDPQQMTQREKQAQATIWQNLGLGHYHADTYHHAIRILQRAYELAPADSDILVDLIHAWMYGGQPEEGLAYLRQQMPRFRRDVRVHLHLAVLQAMVGEGEASLETYERLFQVGQPDDDSHLEEYVTLLIEQGLVDGALKVVHNYQRSQNTRSLAILEAQLLAQKGQPEKAAQVLRKWRDGKTFSQPLVQQLVDHCFASGKHDEVLKLCDELLANGFDSANTYFQKGRSELELQKYGDALKSLEAASERSPTDASIAHLLERARKLVK